MNKYISILSMMLLTGCGSIVIVEGSEPCETGDGGSGGSLATTFSTTSTTSTTRTTSSSLTTTEEQLCQKCSESLDSGIRNSWNMCPGSLNKWLQIAKYSCLDGADPCWEACMTFCEFLHMYDSCEVCIVEQGGPDLKDALGNCEHDL